MKTDTPVPTITAEAVAAWLVAQTKALNLPKAQLTVYVNNNFPNDARWMAEACDLPFVCADTFDEAVAKLRAKIKSPADLAAEKRAAAQKLLSEAAALEAPAVA